MAVDARRLEGLSLQELSALLDDEGRLQDMAREMEEDFKAHWRAQKGFSSVVLLSITLTGMGSAESPSLNYVNACPNFLDSYLVLKPHCAQNVQHSKDMTLASNRSLAEGNLLYQPRLESLKANLTQKYQELQVIFEAYQIKKTKLDSQSSNASLETLLALLQTEGAKIEEDTENMAEKFLDGEIPLDSFIDEYQSKRKLAHLRRVKIEKLQEMVLKGQRLPQAQLQAQPRAPETTPAPQASYASDANSPPSVMPRRIPPPPPSSIPAGRFPTPFTAAMSSGPAVSYPGAPYPPLPPRLGVQSAGPVPQPGYPSQFVPQYPPALPQRPPRLPPHPGFILQ